jgi:hypothetical protein
MPQLEWTKLPLDDALPTWWATSNHTMPNGTPLRYEILGGRTYGAFAHNLFLDADNAHRRHFESLEAAKAACQQNENALDAKYPRNAAELLAACKELIDDLENVDVSNGDVYQLHPDDLVKFMRVVYRNTKREWIVAAGAHLLGKNGQRQIAIFTSDDDWEKEQKANIDLICAAPDLLAACEKLHEMLIEKQIALYEFVFSQEEYDDVMDATESAIAKAQGTP